MLIFRLGFYFGVVFLSAVAIFLGLAVTLAAVGTGRVTYSYVSHGEAVVQSVSRAEEPSRYWSHVALLGMLPMVVGAAGVWWGRRRLYD